MTKKKELEEYIKEHMFRRDESNLTELTKAIIMFPTEPCHEIKTIVEYETEEEKAFYLSAAGNISEKLKEALTYKVISEDNVLALLTMLRLLSSHLQLSAKQRAVAVLCLN